MSQDTTDRTTRFPRFREPEAPRSAPAFAEHAEPDDVLAAEHDPPQGWAGHLPPAPAPGDERDPSEEGPPPHHSLVRRRPLAMAFAAALSVSLAAGGTLYWDHARHFESTDDAFIAARQFAIAPKVPGYLSSVPVTDNQHVASGEVIARIDDRDFRTALAQAEAQVAASAASIRSIDAQIAVQEAQVVEDQAQVEQAKAALVFAREQAARFADLAQRGYGPVQTAQQTASQQQQQQAAVRTSQAAVEAAQRQIAALKAQRANAEANLAQASAQRDQAALNLSYTVVTAAQPGRVVALSAAVGEYVAAGTSLTMFVPDEIWVAANYKETQLDAMRPGQPADMRIDAYPERAIHGHVASVQPGSGTAFSLLPVENATGNFVKITQRVPVKVVIDDPPGDVSLGPGMSVVPTVRVDPAPSLYERLRASL
jgi:membrane fusion protein, multidrug efflux system